jgi:hypothetical protein
MISASLVISAADPPFDIENICEGVEKPVEYFKA